MGMDQEHNVAEQLKEWRRRARVTQRNLAAASGISLSFIQQVEQGTRGFSYDTATRIAEALGLDVYDTEMLYDLSDVSPPVIAPGVELRDRVDDLERQLDELKQQIAGLRADYAELVRALSVDESQPGATPPPRASASH